MKPFTGQQVNVFQKKLRRCFAVLLCVALLLTPQTAMLANTAITFLVEAVSSGTAGEGVTWELSDDGVLTLTGTGRGILNAFPSGLNKADVQRLVISDGVKEISGSAFSSCTNLTAVTAVNQTDLTYLGPKVFEGCTALEQVDLSGCSNLGYIGDSSGYYGDVNRGSTFKGCTSLQTVNLSGCASLKHIKAGTFYDCSALSNLDFTGCTSLEIIGGQAFRNCTALTTFDNAHLPALSYIGSNAFNNCTGLLALDFSSNAKLATIDKEAFYGCTSVTTLNLSGCPLSYLGEKAFQNCTALVSVDLSDSGLASSGLQSQVFMDCSSLVSVDFSGCENLLELRALFNNCSSLETVDLSNCTSLQKFLGSSLRGLPNLTRVILDGCTSITTIGQEAFRDSPKLEMDLSDIPTLEVLDSGAFSSNYLVHASDFSKLTHLKKIYNGTFNGRSFIRDLDLSGCKELSVIGGSAFQNLNGLRSVNLSGAGTEAYDADGNFIGLTIGDKAFEQHNAKDINISKVDMSHSGVVSIGASAFTGWGNNIREFDLTGCDKLKTIGAGAMSLSTATVLGLSDCTALESIGEGAFQNTKTETADLNAPHLTTIGNNAFNGCASLSSANLTGCTALTSIGNNAFANCRSLSSADLSNCTALTTISTGAFNNTILESVSIPKNVTSIASDAFSGVTSLQSVYWDAADYTAAPSGWFNGSSGYDLTIGKDVDALPSQFFTNVKGYGDIFFEGVNESLVLSADAMAGAPEPLEGVIGTCYVDEYGVVYQLHDDDTATLVYCPPGIGAYTVPETVGGKTVTAVGNRAFKLARGLKDLTFASPSNIKDIGAYAFNGLSALEKINGTNLLSEIIELLGVKYIIGNVVAGTQIIDDVTHHHWDPGKSDTAILNQDVSVYVSDDVSAKRDEDGVYQFKTGESLVLNIDANLREAASDAYALIYLEYSNTGYLELSDVSYQDKDGTPIYDMTVCDTEEAGIKCLVVKIYQGQTASFPIVLQYPSKNPITPGGDLEIWTTEPETEPEVENGAVVGKIADLQKDDSYIAAKWSTQPRARDLQKSTSSAVLDIIGDGKGGGYAQVGANTWKIDLNYASGTNDNNGIGADYVYRADFTDTIQLPAPLQLSPEAISAIANKQYTRKSRQTSGGNTQYYFVMPDGNGKTKELFYIEVPVGSSATGFDLGLDEKQQPVIKWTMKNDHTTELHANNIQLGFAEGTLVARVADIAFDPGKSTVIYQIENTISADVSYEFSGITTLTSAATKRAQAREAELHYSKTRETYVDPKGAALLGSDMVYLLTAENIGVTPTDALRYVEDSLREDGVTSQLLYIKPENLEKMFGESYGKLLTVTIANAVLYSETAVPGDTAKAIDGIRNVPLTDDNSATSYTASYGHTIVITKNENGYTFVLDGADAVSFTSVDAGLKSFGYRVTGADDYTVRWDFGDGNDAKDRSENTTFHGGMKVNLPVYATHKSSLQLLPTDEPGHYHDSWPRKLNNVAIFYDDNGLTRKSANEYNVTYEVSIEKSISGYRAAANPETLITSDKEIAKVNYGNGDFVSYDITVRNSGVVLFDMPVTDDIGGAQVLLVPKDGNSHLDARGLETVRVGGMDYYRLSAGSYENVYVYQNGTNHQYLASSIFVDETGTHLKWYYPSIAGKETITYLTQVTAPQEGQTYEFSNKAWLNDRRDDRLWATVSGRAASYSVSKKIVTANPNLSGTVSGETLADLSNITRNKNVVTYRIAFSSGGPNVKVNWANIVDTLPLTYQKFAWHQGTAPGSDAGAITMLLRPKDADMVEYYYNGQQTDGSAFTQNWVVDDSAVGDYGQYYIKWTPSATGEDYFRFLGETELYLYVTVTFPNEADIWHQYCQRIGGRLLNNKIEVDDRSSIVYHNMLDEGQVALQKGVNNIYQMNLTDDRTYYGNAFGFVEYYVTLYNGGNSRFYLSDLTDTLPKGFTFSTMKPGDIKNTNSKSWATQSGSQISAVTITDPLREDGVKFVKATVSVTESPQDEHGVQTLAFSFNRTGKDDDGSNPASASLHYDSQQERYFLQPGEAVAFTYIAKVDPDEAKTEDKARNRITMDCYDPESVGVSLYEFANGDVRGAAREGVDNNDGSRLLRNNETGGKQLMSDVTVMRGKILPGIRKTVTAYDQGASKDIPISNGGSISGKPDTLKWSLTAYNNGVRGMGSYSITDTMQHHFYFGDHSSNTWSDVNYSVFNTKDEKIGAVQEVDTEKEAPLFRIRYFNGEYQLQESGGTSIIHVTPGEPVDLTLPAVWTSMDGKRISTTEGEHPLTLSVRVTLSSDLSRNQIMRIDFPENLLPLMPGGYGIMTYETSSGSEFSTMTYFNTALLQPADEDLDYIAGNVLHGTPVLDDAGENVGVQSRGFVTLTGQYATTSEKTVTERENTSNAASSLNDNHTIILPDQSSKFYYGLEVQYIGNVPVADMVIIDNLPQIDDIYTVDAGMQRNSEFRVDLCDDPNVRVFINTDEAGHYPETQWRALDSDLYTVSLSEKNDDFTADDWNRSYMEGWNAAPAAARSLRVCLSAVTRNGEKVFPIEDKSKIRVVFDAQVHRTGDAEVDAEMRGLTAYNSFAYRYQVVNTNSWLEASTDVVGVRVPDFPYIQKQLLHYNNGQATAAQDTDFHFLVFPTDGERLPSLEDVFASNGKIDEAKLKQALATAGLGTESKDYHVFDITVRKDTALSERKNLYLYQAQNGWTWTNGTEYTVIELLPPGKYEFVQWDVDAGDATVQSDMPGVLRFTYNAGMTQIFRAENMDIAWNASLTKVDAEKGKPLVGAVFARYRLSTDKKGSGHLVTGTQTHDFDGEVPAEIQDNGETWVLIDVVEVAQTNAERGQFAWEDMHGDKYRIREVKAPHGYSALDQDIELWRYDPNDGTNTLNRQIANQAGFVMPSVGGIGTDIVYFAGVLALCAAALLGILSQRRRRRTDRS